MVRMTKEHREAAYKHFRDLEKNYTALSHLDSGVTSTAYIRAKAKRDADKLLARNPELEAKPVEIVEKPKIKKTSKGD